MNLHYELNDDTGIIEVSDQLQLSDAVAILQAAFGSDLKRVELKEAAE